MKNYSKSNNVVNEYEDVYLENLESKEYFEYLLKYYKSWKKSSPSEFNYLFGKDRVEAELEKFLEFDFFPRVGGGIGMTRMIAALDKNAEN